jgi:hypothetical protein
MKELATTQNSFAFKDVPGTWRVLVDFSALDANRVTVTHCKTEQSSKPNLFRFDWSIRLSLNRADLDRALVELRVHVDELRFMSDADEEMREDMSELLEDFRLKPTKTIQ